MSGGVEANFSPMPQTRSLQIGSRAPMFTLPSSTGAAVALEEVLSRGPVVLAWYLFDFGRI
jgi:peroxiredoxin